MSTEQSPSNDPSGHGEEETRAPEPAESQAGRLIGPYRLLERIGEGGMGEVWLAEQKEPVRRRVALKLIKAGMDTREVVSRFQSERQALALMDHPAIAKVFDAGSTPLGRPYFAMEYVPGLPITTFADKHHLTTRQRLELFIHVCEGVQHAHQKAIIHRDLKPSNILVSEVDGHPMPRIIDFGVAKATSQRLSGGTVFTQVGAIIGTLGYMSPEQADSGGEDIDTRSDVYSLGVVLYELLVGSLPHDFQRIALDQILRHLREDDVARPSTRVRTQSGESVAAAKNRNADPQTLTRQLRGDPDAITLKALEKDRKRRYSSPSDLAADIGRYLRNEPVAAHPPSASYRAAKYIRRHRVGVALAAVLLLLLVGFSIAQTVAVRRITRERDRADRITGFMTDMFKVSDPSQARGSTVTAREILDKASANIDTGLKNDPVLQASMMYIMGDVYDGLGQYQQAETLMSRALQIRRSALGEKNANTLNSAARLAAIYQNESRYPEAEKLARETLEKRRAALGAEDRDTLLSMSQLGGILADEAKYADAEKLDRELASIARRKFGPNDKLSREAMVNLAIALAQQGRYAEAENSFREVLEMDRKAMGYDHPDVLTDMNNLGAILMQERRYPESEQVYREAVQLKQRVLGPDHPDTLDSMGSLATDLLEENRFDEAEKLYRDTLEIKRKKLGPEHRSTLVTQGNLADALQKEGKFPESEQLYRQTLEAEVRKLGPEHSDTLNIMDNLGTLLIKENRLPEAEKILREFFDRQRHAFGEDAPDTSSAAYDLASALARQGKRDEAFTDLQFALDHTLYVHLRAGISTNTDFASLHGDPRWAAIIAKAAQPASAQTPP